MLAEVLRLDPGELTRLAEAVRLELARYEERVERLAGLGSNGRCPGCGVARFIYWGTTGAGDQRYRCKGCGKTCTGLTGTSLVRLKKKDRLETVLAGLKAGKRIGVIADEVGLHRNVVSRWRKLLIAGVERAKSSA